MLCTCATTRAAIVVSKSKDSASFSRPTVPHSQQYHLIVGPLGPVQSYASWASTTALGIFDGTRGFFRCAEFLSAGQKQFVAPADGSCSLLGRQFLLFFCGSRADPSCQDVTVTRSLSGRCSCTARSPEKQLFRLVDGAIYISGLSGSN